MSRSDGNGWISFEDALDHTGRSPATLRRAVAAGKVSKTTISLPGRRPEVHLSRADLDKVFGQRTHVPSVAVTERNNHDQSGVSTTERMELQRKDALLAEMRPLFALLADSLRATQKIGETYQLDRKLTWSMREAREMTGLSRPALGELAEAHPECVIRRGRRVWFKAAGLRGILG